MSIETATYMLPENLLCYFHYGDEEGLDDRDLEIIRRWERSTKEIPRRVLDTCPTTKRLETSSPTMVCNIIRLACHIRQLC